MALCQSIFVTGASGLLGSNVCRLAAQQGRDVRGLVRNPADAAVLEALGVQPVLGDITDPASLGAGLGHVEGVIHAAAVIGGTWSTATRADFHNVNYQGTINVLDAARAARVGRTILISSLAALDMTATMTERSPMARINPAGSAYVLAKLAAYYAGMHRACQGENVGFVFPGAMYGPSPFIERALAPTLFTGTLLRAIRGQLARYARFPLTWPYVADAAQIALAALDHGGIGERYLAGGRPEDTMSLAEFCNIGCELAGVDHRVEDVDPAALVGELGSMRELAELRFATPAIDPTATTRALGVVLTPVREGVARTVAWLRHHGHI